MVNVAFVDLNNGKSIGEVNIGLVELISYIKSHLDIHFAYFSNLSSLKTSWSKFDIIALSCRGYEMQIRDLLWLKKIPRLKVCGGPGPTILPHFALRFSDIVVLGEGEIPFQRILELFMKLSLSKTSGQNILRSKRLRRINNICTSEFCTPREFYDFDIPQIDWSIIPDLETYISNWHYLDYIDGIRGVSLVSSRSCPFQCSFCQPTVNLIFGKKVKYKPLSSIENELRYLAKNYGVNAFIFHDDTFTLREDRVNSIIDMLLRLRSEGLFFYWIFNTRAGLITDSLAQKLSLSGAIQCHIGIETLNEKVRNGLLNKGVSDSSVYQTIRLLKKNNILSLGFFMIGLPGYSVSETFKEIINVANTDLDLATFSVLTVLPGTYLSKQKFVKSFVNYYAANSSVLTRIHPIILNFIRIFAYLIFYFHPKRILRTFRQLINLRTFKYKLERLIGELK